MSEFLLLAALFVLATIALGLVRVHRGPSRADRIASVQLIGTGGVAVTVLLAGASGDAAIIDVGLVLALLAAFAAVAFVKSASSDGAGDPEESDET
ncbi:MAG: monovalent cation/H+ antiporter complex subunit F [Mesorhizobium sp.]|nr:monovalent cation/H+ antiporter complex subunit F [Mesorhizobium sp.]